MTTYVQNKTRMFMERRDWLRPERRRSESRLKAYPSSTDLRNWCNVVEDRRQHILELVQKRIDKCPGKLIPLDALLNMLMDMAEGAGDSSKIKRCLRQLSNFTAQLKLNSEDLRKLKKTVGNMDVKCIASLSMAMVERLGERRGADDDEERQAGRYNWVRDIVEDRATQPRPVKMVRIMRVSRRSEPHQQERVEDDPDKVATLEALCNRQRNKIEALTRQRDTLQTKLDACLKELDKLKKQAVKDKLRNLEDLTKERDDLAGKVRRLEAQLEDLSGNAAELTHKLEILDNVLQERDNLSKRINMMRGMEEEMERLRIRAERMDELERELRNTSKAIRNAELELKKTQSRAANLEIELLNVKCEREVMNKRIKSMKKEMDSQKTEATKAEMLRVERDLLQIKLSELADLQSHYEEITEKMELLVTIKAERDAYKQKYEEALDGECRCHLQKIDEAKAVTKERDQLRQQVLNLGTCISEREDEIRGLVLRVDSLARSRSNSSSRKGETVGKEWSSTPSQDEIARVQTLNSRVKELEKLLHNAEHAIIQKDCHIRCLESQVAYGSGSRRNLPDRRLQEISSPMRSVSGDQHLKKLLKQSEYAVKRVVQELAKQDQEWGHVEVKNPKRNFGSSQGRCPCPPASGFNGDDCGKMRGGLEELQKGEQKSELAGKRV